MRFTPGTIRSTTHLLSLLLLLAMRAAAQETQSPQVPSQQESSSFRHRLEFSVQGAGFFAESRTALGIQDRVTKTGGFLFGTRFNITRRFAVETKTGFERSTQIYSGATAARVQANVVQFTPAFVYRLPGSSRIHPYVFAGGGFLIFDPTNNRGGTFPGTRRETKGAAAYGGGADYVLTRHIAMRVEFRGLNYSVPSFHLTNLKLSTSTFMPEPSAGFVFRF